MDEMELKIRLEAETEGYERAISVAKDRLAELAGDEKLLKQSEREITAELNKSIKLYGAESEQVKRLRIALAECGRGQKELAFEIEYATKEMKEQQALLEKTTKAANQNTSAMTKNAKQAESAMSAIKGSFTAIKGLIVGYAGKTLYDALIGSNAEFEQKLTSFEVLLQSAEKAETMMHTLEDFAAKTPLETDDVTTATQLLLGYGLAEDEVIEKMQQLGDLSQGSAEKLNRISLAYGQMLAKGKVAGQELRQMTEAGVPLMQALADSVGVTTGELSKLIEKGKVGIPELNTAIESMTSEGGQFFGMLEKQSQTGAGLLSTIKDNVKMLSREMGEQTFNELKGELDGLLQSLNQMRESGVAKEIGQDIAGAINFVTDFVKILWNLRYVLLTVGAGVISFKAAMAIGPVITSATTAVKALSSAEAIHNLVMGESVLLRNTQTGAITLETAAVAASKTAVEGATVAQVRLNTAMLASPWFLIPAAIVAVGIAMDGLTVTYKEQMDALNDLQSAYDETKGELQSVQSEIEKTNSEIDKIQSKGTLSLTDKKDLQELKEQNAELERRSEILQNELKIQKEQVNQQSIAAVKKRYDTGGRSYTANIFSRQYWSNLFSTDYWEGALSGLQDFGVYANRIIALQVKLNEETKPEKLSKYNEELSEYKAKMADVRAELLKVKEGITETDEAAEQARQQINDQLDFMNKFLFTAEELKKMEFDDLFNSAAFESSKNQLIETAKAGKVTQETLDSYPELIKLMEQTGMTASEVAGEIQGYAKTNVTLEEEMDKVKDRLMDLGGVQEQIREGHVFSYSEIEELREKYEELEPYIKRTADGWEIEKDAVDTLTTGVRFTQDEINTLIRIHPELDGHIKETSDGLYIEKEALDKVGKSAMQLKVDASKSQVEMTLNVLAESSNRIKAFKDEVLAIKNLADAYKVVSKMGAQFGMSAAEMSVAGNFGSANTYEEYVNNVTGGRGMLGLPFIPDAMSKEEFEQLKRDSSALLAAGKEAQKTYEEIEKLEKELGEISAGGVTGSDPKKTGTKKDNSAKEAEKARQERVKAYVDEVAEKTRVDDRWRSQKKAYGQMDLEQEKQFLQNKIADYQYYAAEVCKLEYFTQAEKDQYYKQFMEKADDYALEIFEIDKKIEEERIKVLKAGYDQQVKMSERLIAQREKEGDFTALVEEYENMKAYLEEYYAKGALTAQEHADKLYDIDQSITDAHREAYEQQVSDSEKYISDRNHYEDWGTDTEIQAIERLKKHHEEAYKNRYITYSEYIDKIDNCNQRIYDLEKERMEELVKDMADQLKEKYQNQLDKRVESLKAAAEREKEIAENKRDAVNAAADDELEKIEELIQARKRQKEDDDDNLKLQRLQYKLQYEHDEDNKRSLEKEIKELQEDIEDKEFDREMEDRKAAIQAEKELKLAQIDDVLEYETSASERRIDAITKRYAKKMSDKNIALEVANNLNLGEWEKVGEQIGTAITGAMEAQIRGFLSGVWGGLNDLVGAKKSFGGVTNYNTTNKSVSYSTNVYGPPTKDSIYEINKANKKMQDAAEMRGEWD